MNVWSIVRVFAAMLILLAVAAACDSPTDPADHPAGAVFLRTDGSEAARFVYGEGVTGQLQVDAGATVTYLVRVLTERGDIVGLDGSEYSIRLPGIVLAAAATIALQGADQLVITGVEARTTSIYFQLHHGEHEEFGVSRVPLIIL